MLQYQTLIPDRPFGDGLSGDGLTNAFLDVILDGPHDAVPADLRDLVTRWFTEEVPAHRDRYDNQYHPAIIAIDFQEGLLDDEWDVAYTVLAAEEHNEARPSRLATAAA